MSSNISYFRTSIVLVLFLVTYFFLLNVTGSISTPILKPLGAFPDQLGSWKLVSTQHSSSEVIDLLQVDDYIDYSYADTKDRKISLYVGYYESVQGGKGYHSPKNCIPGGGWGIDRVETVIVRPRSRPGALVEITEMIIRNRNEYQVVLYWYQNRGRIIATEYLEKIYLILDAFYMGRRDGAFVRLITHAPDGDIPSTKESLQDFAEVVIAELDQHLPGKFLNN